MWDNDWWVGDKPRWRNAEPQTRGRRLVWKIEKWSHQDKPTRLIYSAHTHTHTNHTHAPTSLRRKSSVGGCAASLIGRKTLSINGFLRPKCFADHKVKLPPPRDRARIGRQHSDCAACSFAIADASNKHAHAGLLIWHRKCVAAPISRPDSLGNHQPLPCSTTTISTPPSPYCPFIPSILPAS